LSDSDDERGDKEERNEHDDEGSLYAEAASEWADDDNTGIKTKNTTAAAAAAAVAKPRKKDLDLNRLGDSRRPLRYYWADPPHAGYILCWSSSYCEVVDNMVNY
jgi:hypothetical protein